MCGAGTHVPDCCHPYLHPYLLVGPSNSPVSDGCLASKAPHVVPGVLLDRSEHPKGLRSVTSRSFRACFRRYRPRHRRLRRGGHSVLQRWASSRNSPANQSSASNEVPRCRLKVPWYRVLICHDRLIAERDLVERYLAATRIDILGIELAHTDW